jgi:hypothetical protein
MDLVKIAWRTNSAARFDDATIRSMFLKAQWALVSDAAAALSQMAARSTKGGPKLAELVRERQDLLADWQSNDAARTAAQLRPPEMRNKEAEAAVVSRISAAEERLEAIDAQLKFEFPEFDALTSIVPVSIESVQADLKSDEALVLTIPGLRALCCPRRLSSGS